jgi:plasmid maintenance system antidote protein VapI
MAKSSITTRKRTSGERPMQRIMTHPGEVLLEEFMKPLGLSANALATALRVPATRIGEIVQATAPCRPTRPPA